MLDVILSYVMRRLLCEMPTNALNKVFASMVKDIEQYKDKELCDRVAAVLAGKKGKVKICLYSSFRTPAMVLRADMLAVKSTRLAGNKPLFKKGSVLFKVAFRQETGFQPQYYTDLWSCSIVHGRRMDSNYTQITNSQIENFSLFKPEISVIIKL